MVSSTTIDCLVTVIDLVSSVTIDFLVTLVKKATDVPTDAFATIVASLAGCYDVFLFVNTELISIVRIF